MLFVRVLQFLLISTFWKRYSLECEAQSKLLISISVALLLDFDTPEEYLLDSANFLCENSVVASRAGVILMRV